MDARVKNFHVNSMRILLCIGLFIKSIYTDDGHWSLEVQLLNYTNANGVYYNASTKSPCCCQSLTLACGPLSLLNCGYGENSLFQDCSSSFTFCFEGNCIKYPQEFSTATVTFSVNQANVDTVYSALIHNGVFQQNTAQFTVTVSSQDTYIKPSYFIENFTIPLTLVRTDTFTPITNTAGIHNIATITISYLSFCSANYFNNDCSVYCLEGDSDTTGYYTCDYNNGDKICKDGYTNPANDCRDQQSQATSVTVTVTVYSTKTSTTSCSIKDGTSSTTESSISSTVAVTIYSTITSTTSCSINVSSQNKQVQNKSTINSCTDEKAGLATVTILLILTYFGLAIIIIVKVLICWKLNDKKADLSTYNQALINPNYDILDDNVERKNKTEQLHSIPLPVSPSPYEILVRDDDDDSLYAPLINTPPNAVLHPSQQDSQYDVIDSQGTDYAFIDDGKLSKPE